MSTKRRYSLIATPSSSNISSKFSSVSDSHARPCSSKSLDQDIRSESDLLPTTERHDENINNLFGDTSVNVADVSASFLRLKYTITQ